MILLGRLGEETHVSYGYGVNVVHGHQASRTPINYVLARLYRLFISQRKHLLTPVLNHACPSFRNRHQRHYDDALSSSVVRLTRKTLD
jgi:hypothetical protein